MIDDLPICEVDDPDLDRPAPRFQNDEPAGESDRPIDPDLHEVADA